MRARKLTPEEIERYTIVLTQQDIANIKRTLGLPDNVEIKPY